MNFHFMSTKILNIFLMKKNQKEVLFQIFLLTKKKKGSFDPSQDRFSCATVLSAACS